MNYKFYILFISSIFLYQCKNNINEGMVDTKTVVHGINDQVISGNFFSVNSLGIEHIINIIKTDIPDEYQIEIIARNTDQKPLYKFIFIGKYNGYAMEVPVNINSKQENWLFNFHENQLQLQSENNDVILLRNYYTEGNYLPKDFVHIDQVAVGNIKTGFDFLKNYVGKNALESDILNRSIFVSHIIKLLKSDANQFFENAKFSSIIYNNSKNIFEFNFCNNQTCNEITFKIKINIQNKRIDLEYIKNGIISKYSEKIYSN